MYCIHFAYGDTGRYFATGDGLFEQLSKCMQECLYVGPFAKYLEQATPKQTCRFSERIIPNLEKGVMNKPIADLLVFYNIWDDDESLLPCSKKRYEEDPAGVLNGLADYYGVMYAVSDVEEPTIVVVDRDHEPLSAEYEFPSLTLWHDEKSFIDDTEFNRNRYRDDYPQIRSYDDAVRYWKESEYEVIDNNIARIIPF